MNEVSDQGLPGNSSPNGKETKSMQGLSDLASVHHHCTVSSRTAQSRRAPWCWSWSCIITREVVVHCYDKECPSKCPQQSDPPTWPSYDAYPVFFFILVYHNCSSFYFYFHCLKNILMPGRVPLLCFFLLFWAKRFFNNIYIYDNGRSVRRDLDYYGTSSLEINIISCSWLDQMRSRKQPCMEQRSAPAQTQVLFFQKEMITSIKSSPTKLIKKTQQ